MAEKKKPMSLNDRHQRFLKDFSSSHNRSSRPPPPPPSNLQTEEEKPQHQPVKMKLEGRRRLFKFSSENDQNEEPNFSGIMDFDDSPPLKKDNHHVSVDPPNFSGILDFDSPDMKVRDSVDDLSSKIELVLDKGESVDQQGGDGKEYDSAGSSFSLSPDRPDGELSAKTRVESANYEDEGDRFVDCVDSSSSPEEEKSHNEKIEERQFLSKKEDNYEPYFSEVTEGKSLPTKVVDILDNLSHKVGYLSQKKKTDNKVEMISVSSPSITEEESLNQLGRDAATDVNQKHNYDGFAVSISSNSSNVLSDLETKSRAHSETIEVESDRSVDGVISSNPSEEERLQPQKVKLEGRRRLCKVSSNDVDNSVPLDGPSFSAITDLDSPPSNIRDILNDLSSRMDYLSIDKKKVGKVERVSDSSLSITKEEPPNLFEGYGEGDMKQKYSNAYSLSPFPSDLLTNLDTKFKLHNAKTEDEGDRRVNCVDKVQMVDKSQRKDKNIKKIEKSVSKRSVLVGDDDEDPYLILSNAQSTKKIPNRASEVKDHVEDCISVDASMDTSGDWVFEDGESIILSGKPSNYILPGKIAKILYPHQRNGLRWLWSLHCMGTGGILGDDMGLGKTMQICSFLAGLFHSGLIKRVMVVAPKTLLTHWIKELKVVGLSEKIREYFGTCAKLRQYELEYILQGTGILLTTYDIVRNNFKSLRGDSFFLDERTEDTITWDYTILDEGHIIKNPSTQRAKSLLEIPSGHRIIISGTPIQNNLKELWALFSFCCPALLGDKKEFKVRYEAAILRGNEKNATEREKRIGSTVAKELRGRIEPYFLRRLKSEVFVDGEATNSSKLSKKNEMIVWLRLTQCQRQLYEAFLNSELVLSSFDGSPLAALTVLKKICDHPYLLTKRAAEDVLEGMETMLNQDDLGILEKMALHLANATNSENFQNLIDNVSCKITFILSLLDNLIPEGHNVLIFSQTRKMLNFVQEAIISRGYKFLRIDGTTKISDREKIVNDFQEGKGAPIFLLTSQVGGLGLTLTKADRVIVVDPAWNPSTDNQSVDRAYRIGQTKDVLVYRLMTCGTIEEKIYRMQVFKGGLFKSATEHKEQTRYFSQHDLRELFSLPKEGFDVSVTQRQLDEEHDQHHIMNDSLKEHVEFLKSHGIAGVSHHSLLFSKTAPVSVVQISDEVPRKKETIYVGSSPSSSSVERSVDGSEYAFNPKDVRPSKKSNAVVTPNKLTESEIRDKLERLRQAYENKTMMSKLPDRGERLKRQIANLNMELEKMNVAESSEAEIIDLDDISGKLERIYV